MVEFAHALDQDPDWLLALAGRVASELSDIIRREPRGMATFLRAANGLSAEQLAKLAEEAKKEKQSE